MSKEKMFDYMIAIMITDYMKLIHIKRYVLGVASLKCIRAKILTQP